MRHARVIGPTPPGTGVITDALSFAGLIIHVAAELAGLRVAVYANVDDGSTFAHHVGSDEARTTDSHHEDVGG